MYSKYDSITFIIDDERMSRRSEDDTITTYALHLFLNRKQRDLIWNVFRFLENKNHFNVLNVFLSLRTRLC